MSGLPKGWTLSKLGTICGSGQYGWTSKAHSQGKLKYLRTTDITKGMIDWSSVPYCLDLPSDYSKYQIQNNDILISRAGSVGFSTLIMDVDVTAIFASYLIRYKPTLAVEPRYISLFLKSNDYWGQISDASSGIALANVNATKLSALKIPLAPLPEQKRIADKLDSVLARVDACCERLDRVQTILKRFRQSVLAAATSGRLTEDWRKSHQEDKEAADTTERDPLNCLMQIQQEKKSWLQKHSTHNEAGRIQKRLAAFSASAITCDELPDSWCWSALEDAVLMVVDCHNKTAPYEVEGIALVRTTNIRDGRFVWEDLRFVNNETYQFWSKRCLPEPGDIVFTREAPMGEAAIIPANTKICLGQRTMLIRPIRSVTNESYLLLALLDPMFKARAETSAVGTGVKHLRVGDVSELKLPLPPTTEQHEIVRRVEILFAFADRLEARLANARHAADKLTSALLAKAFRGELVPQDPNDEPAAELLKRLAASREAAGNKPKRGRKALASSEA